MDPVVLPIDAAPQGVAISEEVKNRPVRTISREVGGHGDLLTPQRLHAELLVTSAARLESYLQGALKDATRSALHGTHRIGQSERAWLETLQVALGALGHRSWIYREGRERNFWVLETTARFLSIGFEPDVDTREGLDYVRGYFDADGGMPRSPTARLYFQFCQKDKESLERVAMIISSAGIACGRIHNPSAARDPDYWRFFVGASSHERFMERIGSWHPIKRAQISARMKI